MRHQVAGRKLNRDYQHRQALFTNLVSALIEHGEIVTTIPKAKAIKALVDKLVTKAKKGTLSARRQIDKVLNKRTLVNRLVDEIAPKTGKRTSGFTRLVRLNARRGDAVVTARLSFVDQVITPVAAPVKVTETTAVEAVKAAVKKPVVKAVAQKVTKPVASKAAPALKVAKKRGDK